MSVNSKSDGTVVGFGESDGRELARLQGRVAALEAEIAQLRAGMASRQQIGLITGVLTERFGLTPEQTWQVIVRLSKQTNIKVRDIARVLETGYFGQLADEDLRLAAVLNEHLPRRGRLPDGDASRAADRSH